MCCWCFCFPELLLKGHFHLYTTATKYLLMELYKSNAVEASRVRMSGYQKGRCLGWQVGKCAWAGVREPSEC